MNRIVKLLAPVFMTAAILLAFSACADNAQSSASDSSATADTPTAAHTDVALFEINTRFGTVNFPEKWQGIVSVDVTDEKISVYMITDKLENQKVFEILFGDQKGTPVGKIGEEKVYVETYDMTSDDAISEEEKENFYLIMEDINYLLQSLKDNCGMEFTISGSD